MDLFNPQVSLKITPRPYQQRSHEEFFRLYDAGHRGMMDRVFTGGGKTPMACMKMNTWLHRDKRNRVLVVSYETQLVWQFAEEIEDFLGLTPGIEMEKEAVQSDNIPLVTVACRASLLRAPEPTQDQKDELALLGITDIGACDKRSCKSMLRLLHKGADADMIREAILDFNTRPEVSQGFFSRVHKFDWRYNWMVVFDEAHRHAKSLKSVGHIVDWFGQNPASCRDGMTATPKRGDRISVGHTMFPAVCVDYPLYSHVKPCGVKDGWAVPYAQKYIQVEGLDFKNIKKIAGDYDPDDLERVLNTEAMLAKLIEPLLDLVGERRTLIFNPGVEMAKNVARYINARALTECPCGVRRWHPKKLIGDGARCVCGNLIEPEWIVRDGEHAQALWGEVATLDRKRVYKGHQSGEFQFLSVCGLCREGYNDPDISCVACFRPTSKKASSLAEQIKGRGCRPARKIRPLLEAAADAAERCRIIAESEKPDCLIVDPVGITGLADCAATVEIYADGLPDEVVEKARTLIESQAVSQEVNIEEAIDEAQKICAEEKERARREREEAEQRAQEEAERRAKAQAEVAYTTHDVGVGGGFDFDQATEKQMNCIEYLGMKVFNVALSKKQAGRILSMLWLRKPLDMVAELNGLADTQWTQCPPTVNQRKMMSWKRLPSHKARSKHDATLLICAEINPGELREKLLKRIADARNADQLHSVALDLVFVKGICPLDVYHEVVAAGKAKRQIFLPREPGCEG